MVKDRKQKWKRWRRKGREMELETKGGKEGDESKDERE